MALADIRSAIKTAMQTVASIGVVNDYEPHATREETVRTFFKSAALAYLRGWSITREMTPELNANTHQNASAHLIVIRGYQALDTAGATEKDFQDLVETVRVELRKAMRTTYGLGAAVVLVGEPSVRIFEPRSFAGVLVHYVEITQSVTEHLDIG